MERPASRSGGSRFYANVPKKMVQISAQINSQCGQIASITNAAGHVWTFDTYNANGQVTHITLPNTSTITFAYDPRERLISKQESGGGTTRTTTYDYYANGLLKRITKPNGAYLNYTYNDARLLT